jgi:hypothetical protein
MNDFLFFSKISKVIRNSRVKRLVVEFSPTDGPEDGGEFFVQTNPLEQVHIVDTSVSKLSMVEGLVLVHLLSGADGDVIAIRGLRNVIMCKITARPHSPVWQWLEV